MKILKNKHLNTESYSNFDIKLKNKQPLSKAGKVLKICALMGCGQILFNFFNIETSKKFLYKMYIKFFFLTFEVEVTSIFLI